MSAGDVEKDFWLAFDLLRSPKDHVEFSVVRDWVRDALKVLHLTHMSLGKLVLARFLTCHLILIYLLLWEIWSNDVRRPFEGYQGVMY